MQFPAAEVGGLELLGAVVVCGGGSSGRPVAFGDLDWAGVVDCTGEDVGVEWFGLLRLVRVAGGRLDG